MDPAIVQSLNPAQLQAVQHPPTVPLQILAGPGSGKTKVLTSRIAHLILTHRIQPLTLCAVTFTNKAANEMRERLVKLLGKARTSQIRMGTFHALCALFLRKHGTLVGLDDRFTICDADESKKIISKILAPSKDDLAAKDVTVKDSTIQSLISNAKSKGITPKTMLKEAKIAAAVKARALKDLPRPPGHPPPPPEDPDNPSFDYDVFVAEVYGEYNLTLRKNNALDFDDLLVFGVKLFKENPKTVEWCCHILVDEFQDTNIMQYQLMLYIAAANRCLTIVGDPDQSIYGWRAAEVENLVKMRKDFPGTAQIFLEKNYRSTGAILKASVAIIAEDKKRIAKTLYTSHALGPTPVLRSLNNEMEEAQFIAIEVKRLVAKTGGMLGWGDFVVLLRFNALSRALESAFQKEAIPHRVLKGHKFFERLEIKDLLAYLQIIDNPQFTPALVRALGAPTRGVGEKSIEELLRRADNLNLSPMEVLERIYDKKIPDNKPVVARKTADFVKTLREMRKLAAKGTSPADLIRRLVELIGYQDHLRKTQPDWESRWENCLELVTFATEVTANQNQNPNATRLWEGDVVGGDVIDLTEEVIDLTEAQRDVVMDVDEIQVAPPPPPEQPPVEGETPLRLFLQASMLSSDGDDTNEDDKNKVTISTCHAAKGLEWPVVMIPAVEDGTFPFYRAEDVEEERRLLYVACTRAQGLLYLSHVMTRKVAGNTIEKKLTDFVDVVHRRTPGLFAHALPKLPSADREVLAKMFDRPVPLETEVAQRSQQFSEVHRYRLHEHEGPYAQGGAWHQQQAQQQALQQAQEDEELFNYAANFRIGRGPHARQDMDLPTNFVRPVLPQPPVDANLPAANPVRQATNSRRPSRPTPLTPVRSTVLNKPVASSSKVKLNSVKREPEIIEIVDITSPPRKARDVKPIIMNPALRKTPQSKMTEQMSSSSSKTSPFAPPDVKPVIMNPAISKMPLSRTTGQTTPPSFAVPTPDVKPVLLPQATSSGSGKVPSKASKSEPTLEPVSMYRSAPANSLDVKPIITNPAIIKKFPPRSSLAVQGAMPLSSTSNGTRVYPITPPTVGPPISQPPIVADNVVVGRKRLGMGRGVMGYPNKKFKMPGT